MSTWGAVKAKRLLAALLRSGWAIKRESGSHRTLARAAWPDFVLHVGAVATRWRRTRRPTLAVVALAGLLSLVAWPGAMNVDALSQLGQVRSGHYNDWHSGVLVPLWRPFWRAGVGPGWVFAGSVVAFTLGVYGTVATAMRHRWAALMTVAVVAFPPILGFVIYWGRDQWFAGALITAFGAAVAMSRRTVGGRRFAAVVFFSAVWMLLATRQNAPPAAFVVVLGALVHARPALVPPEPAEPARRVQGALRVVAVAAAIVVMMLVSQEAIRRVAGVARIHPEQQTMMYDLAAMSVEEGVNRFPSTVYDGDVSELAVVFDVRDVLPLVRRPDPVIPSLDRGDMRELAVTWTRTVRDHPVDYLGARWRMWLHQLAISGPADHVFHAQVDDNEWGYRFAFPGAFERMESYLQLATPGESARGGPFHAVWVYVLATLGGLGYFCSTRPERRLLAWFCLATLVNLGVFFFAAAAASYRFVWPTVVVGTLVSIIVAADLLRLRATRRAIGPATPGKCSAAPG